MAPPRKVKLSRLHDYRITEAEGRPELVGKRCRLQLAAEGEEVEVVGGFILDLRAYMLSGKYAGSVLELPPVKLRYASESEPCRCPAYKFPHAKGLGACKTEKFEQEVPPGLTIANIFLKGKS